MNNEDFVSYEIAIKLKELGFDWECYEFWDTSFCDDGTPIKIRKTTQEPRTCVMSERNSILESIGSYLITAPTMAKAQKWLRETKGMIVLVHLDSVNEEMYVCHVTHLHRLSKRLDNGGEYFLDYKSALSAGIETALKLIEEGVG